MTYSYPTLISVCDFAKIRPQMAEKFGFKDTYQRLIMVCCNLMLGMSPTCDSNGFFFRREPSVPSTNTM